MTMMSKDVTPDREPRRFKVLRIYCGASAVAVAALGVLVLYGWAFDIGVLKSVLPGLVTMKANTALGLVLSGTSLWLLIPGESRARKRGLIARVLAVLVALIGTATLSEYVFGLNLGIDQLLFRDLKTSVGTSSPGRLAPMTAMAFVAIGLALILLDWKTRRGYRPAQALTLCSGLIAMMSINGYIYQAIGDYEHFLYTRVALHTAIALFLLSGAILFARPRIGIAGNLTSDGSGSAMARRFLPAVFGIPILVGWVCLQGELAGLYGAASGDALYATVSIIVFAALIWLSARGMNKEYLQRSRAQVALRKLNAELEERVAERTRALERQAATLVEQAALLDLAQDAVVVRDMSNRILFWNRGAEALFGWSSQEAVGRNTDQLLRSEFSEPAADIEAQILRDGKWEGEASHYTRDGRRLTVACRWVLQRDAGGAPVRILVVKDDITGRKESESRLLLLAERLSLATALAKVGVWERDMVTDVVSFDATMFEIYGLTPIVPMSYGAFTAAVHPDDLSEVEASLQKAIEEKSDASAEFRIFRPDGSVRNVAAVLRVLFDELGNLSRVIGVNMDVTESRSAEQALRSSEARMTHSAQHDVLTGLPNRLLLNDRVKQAIGLARRHMKQVAVLFLDLDGFKYINDSLGHSIGDKLLQSVAGRLVECVRDSDTVSRQGGDEFVVLLSEVAQAEDAAITARRMLQAVAEVHSIDQRDLHITTSIGVSVYPDDGQEAETLIQHADTAMYQAKENGRQSYQFFKPAMNVRAVDRQSIEESLRRAVERQEFTLHYQPIIDLRTGEITGAEALLRWTHPTRGLVSPAQFIPIAEACGLILPIGNWVLREACRQARAWIDAGLPLAIMAVNISAMEFRNENFLEGIFAALEEAGLDPRRLELELTESVLMKRAEFAESILKTLRARGVQLAVDDFGTGYSSLSYLRKFQVDALKIDQSFIRQITTAPDETSIVRAVISMGRSLGLRVVAEGVETLAELKFLQAHDCDEAQGYYFSRPVPAQQFALLLETGIAAKDQVAVLSVPCEAGRGAARPDPGVAADSQIWSGW